MTEYTTLGNLISPAKVIRCGNGSYPVLSMTMHDGIVLQSDRFKKSLASADQSDYKVVKYGQLVVGFPIDEGVLYIQKATNEGIMSPAYNVWDVDTLKVEADYLELCLHSPQAMQYYCDKLRGSTARRRSIPTADLLALPIRLPTLEEQREKLEMMAKMNALIADRHQQLDLTDQLVKSRFIEMFGDPVTNGKRWPRLTLGDICNIGSSKRVFENDYVPQGVPFFRTKEIVELSKGNTISTELFITEEHFSELKSSYGAPKKDDLLISAVGTIGTIWIVSGDFEFYFKDGNLIQIKASPNFNSIFMKYLLDGLIANYKKQMSTGTAYSALTIAGLKKMLVYDIPLSLQQQFAAFVEHTDKSKLEIQKSLEKLETLKKALMQKYFG